MTQHVCIIDSGHEEAALAASHGPGLDSVSTLATRPQEREQLFLELAEEVALSSTESIVSDQIREEGSGPANITPSEYQLLSTH